MPCRVTQGSSHVGHRQREQGNSGQETLLQLLREEQSAGQGEKAKQV